MAIIVVNAGGNFQTALNNAVSGDEIHLEAGATFEGNFRCPNKGALAVPILITTTSAASNFPADGYRIDPIHAPFMPKLRGIQLSNYQTIPALDFAAGARDYIIKRVQFLSNMFGNGNMLEYGFNSTAQFTYSQLPDNVVIDQCYFLGDEVWGQKRAISCDGKAITIKNCYIDYIFGVGQDAVGIGGVNGIGPVTILNNYICAATENIIFGGDDNKIKQFATFASTPAPTNLGGQISLTTDLSVGQWVAILTNAGAQRRHTTIRSINTTTGDVTWDALEGGAIPDAPGDIRWGAQNRNLTVRRNYLTKRQEWQNPLLDTPLISGVIVTEGTGTLAAGTWTYRIQAVRTGGYQNSTYYSTASQPTQVILQAAGQVQINWDGVSLASKYRVWRIAQDATSVYFETTSTTYTDTGLAGTTASIPGGTRTVIKNLFELKTSVDVQIDSNILEYHWRGSDIGQCVWLKTSNSGGTNEYNQTRNIIFEKNLIHHVAGFVSFSGIDVSGSRTPADWPHPTDGAIVRNNLVIDSQDPWTESALVWGIAMNNGARNVTFDHNTVLHQRYGQITLVKRSGLPDRFLDNAVFRNNLFKRNSYGLKGNGSPNSTEGDAAFQAHTNNTGVFERNAMAGLPSNYVALYPTNNIYPTNAEFEAAFVNYDGAVDGDYHLATGTPGNIFRGQGTDGLDLGANVDLVYSSTYGVREGIPENTTPPPPPSGNLGGTLLMFTPVHMHQPLVSFAELDIRNGQRIIAFDGGVSETVYFSGVMPRFYDGQNIQVGIIWTADTETNPANQVVFEAAFDRLNDAGQSLDSASEGVAILDDMAPNIQPGVLNYGTLAFASNQIDGIIAGEAFKLRLTRLPGHANDTLTGDAQVLRVEIRTV